MVMKLFTSYTILLSPQQPTSETYSKPTTYTLHLETLYLQIHTFLYFSPTYSLPSSLQTSQLIYVYASLVFPMHIICQIHVTYITNWLNWFNTMDDNKLSKIILHYQPKGTDIQKTHSKRQLATWAGFILFHVGKKKIITRRKAKDSKEKENGQAH